MDPFQTKFHDFHKFNSSAAGIWGMFPIDTLASKISEFWTYWNLATKISKIRTCPNPWDKDFRIPNFWVSRFPDISNLAWVGPGLAPWVGPWQCCAGAPAARRCAPAQYWHGPTQAPSPASPRPDLRYLGTWKSRSLESH